MSSCHNESNKSDTNSNSTDWLSSYNPSSSTYGYQSALSPALIFFAGALIFFFILYVFSRCAANNTDRINPAEDTDENKSVATATREEMIKDALVIKAVEYHPCSPSFRDNDEEACHRSTFQQVRCPACCHDETEISCRESCRKNNGTNTVIDVFSRKETLHNERRPTGFIASVDEEVDGKKLTVGEPYYCTICLECFKIGEKAAWSKYLTSCPHAFHPDCIASWLRHTSKRQGHANTKDSCPNCRGYFFKTPEAAPTAATLVTDQSERSHNDAWLRRKIHVFGQKNCDNDCEDPPGEVAMTSSHFHLEESIRLESTFCLKHGLVLPTCTNDKELSATE